MSKPVLAWAAWDCGSAAWNAVVTTFVFTVYLTSSSFGGKNETSTTLGAGLTIAGVLVALLAPVIGRRADRAGRGKRWLAVHTVVVVAMTAALFFVRPTPSMLWFGVGALAVGTLFFEFASVNYNALLTSISTPSTIGRVSGLGWGAGYLGGIVLLLILLLGFIQPDVGLFGVTDQDGMNIRVAMLVSAAWFALFALPVFRSVPERATITVSGTSGASGQVRARGLSGLVAAYRELWETLSDLARHHRTTLYFLGASAVFRDGMVGIFTFGGVIAAGTFGFSTSSVIMFGLVANVVAGVATIVGGYLDDRLGPKRIIVGSLVCMIVAGVGIFLAHDRGPGLFWVLGLLLTVFVGPVQSAARSLLARALPPGREGEIFGLYATTGRAVSFLAPLAFSVSIGIGVAVLPDGAEAQHWGILGIVAVLLVGLLLVLPVSPPHGYSARDTDRLGCGADQA
ncbi:MAG TPA: MFS transporter [Dermatophilaceae bacterium]|nr:MFS transporter [Dermatophilaceae bacterium]